jgi:hypothetical protein
MTVIVKIGITVTVETIELLFPDKQCNLFLEHLLISLAVYHSGLVKTPM